MELSGLLSGLSVLEQHGLTSVEVTGVCSDSRKIASGNLFVAIRGERFDAHTVVDEMIQKGAVAVVVEEKPLAPIPYILVSDTREANTRLLAAFYGHPEESFDVAIGITGTNGKTSTSYMLRKIFREAGYKVGLIGTMQYLIDDEPIPLSPADSLLTTPDSELLYRMFARMRDEGVKVLIMEVSSHALYLRKVIVPFDVGVFTNLTQDHLDFHHTMEAYRAEKAKLFSMCRMGVFNGDDPSCQAMMAGASCEKYMYGVKGQAEFFAQDVCDTSADGVSYRLVYQGQTNDITLPIPGSFSVYNSLAAASAALLCGIKPSLVLRALAEMEPVKGRVDRVDVKAPYAVFIDFAHTPDALENVLKTLRGFTEKRLIVLFGCGGDRDKGKRPKMAAIAAELADYVIVTSDNCRSEKKEDIIRDILVGLADTKTPYSVIYDRTEAICFALDFAKEGDVILLAGKGHEEYEIDQNGKHPYSERAIVKQYLSEGGKA